MAPNDVLPRSLQYTIGDIDTLLSTCTRTFPFRCSVIAGVHYTWCIRVLQWKTAWMAAQHGKQPCPCPAHNLDESKCKQGLGRLLQRLQMWPDQIYQFEHLLHWPKQAKRYVDVCLPCMEPARAIEVHGSDHDGHRHSMRNWKERREHAKVQRCLTLGMVCVVLYNRHTDKEWDATLQSAMSPGQGYLHSTCADFLQRFRRQCTQ